MALQELLHTGQSVYTCSMYGFMWVFTFKIIAVTVCLVFRFLIPARQSLCQWRGVRCLFLQALINQRFKKYRPGWIRRPLFPYYYY